MVLLKKNFFVKNSDIDDVPIEYVESYIYQHKEAVEVLVDDSCMGYFDCELSEECINFEERQRIFLNDCRTFILKDLKLAIRYMATSSFSNYKGTISKFSCFIIVDAWGKKSYWQSLAKKFKSKYPFIDTQPYMKNQVLRCINCFKPNEYMLEGRQRVPLIGTFVESLASVRSSTARLMEENQTEVNNPNLKFLFKAFSDPLFADLWKEKNRNYHDWVSVGYCIDHEVKQSECDSSIAEKLFLLFSMHDERYREDEASEKFLTIQGKSTKSLFNKLKGWMYNYDKRRTSALAELSKDNALEPAVSISDIEDDIMDDISYEQKIFEFFPYNRTQFLVSQICNGSRLQQYWRMQIREENDLKKIASLLKYRSASDKILEEKLLTIGNEMQNDTNGSYMLPHPSSNNEDIEILQFYADFCNIHTTECYLQQLMAKQEETKSVQQCFDRALAACNDVDKNYMGTILQMSQAETIMPLAPCEIHDAQERIFAIRDANYLWATQLPYKAYIDQLWEMSDNNEITFLLLVCRACDKVFLADKYFHFIASASSDLVAADIVLKLYPFWIMSNDLFYVFDDSRGMWTDRKDVMEGIISKLSSFLQIPNLKGKNNYGAFNELTTKVCNRIKTHELPKRNAERFEHMKHSSLSKMLFRNGYYDGTDDKFYPCCILSDDVLFKSRMNLFTNAEIFFFAQVPDDYCDTFTDEQLLIMDDMKKTLFETMHGEEVGNYHIESLSLALMGIKHKGFYVHVGETNSGKSTEKAMLEHVFGEYIGTANTDDFASIKDDKREASLLNAFVFDNWYKRILMFSESTDRPLSTEMLKSHSSGGEDKIRARKQYRAAESFEIHYIMFFYVNSSFKVTNKDDPAFIGRARYVYWNKMFVEDVRDPTIQLPARPEVTNWKNNELRRQLYVQIILNGYRAYRRRGDFLPIPDSVKAATKEEVGEIETNEMIMDKLLHLFVFDGRRDSQLSRADFTRLCESRGIDPKKASSRISAVYCKLGISGEKTIYTKQVRVNGTREYQWFGVSNRASLLTTEYDYLTDYAQWCELMQTFKGTIPDHIEQKLKTVAQLCKERRLLLEEEIAIITEFGTKEQIDYCLHKSKIRCL